MGATTALLFVLLQTPQVPAPHPVVVDLSIAAVGITAMVDLSVTEYFVGKGVLSEANPILRPLSDDPIQIGLAKAALTAGQLWVLIKLRERHPVWTFITAGAIAAFNSWAIAHNTREAKR